MEVIFVGGDAVCSVGGAEFRVEVETELLRRRRRSVLLLLQGGGRHGQRQKFDERK